MDVVLGIQTLAKKGYFTDMHERNDIKNYRDEIFLPAMLEFEGRMDKYSRPNMDTLLFHLF